MNIKFSIESLCKLALLSGIGIIILIIFSVTREGSDPSLRQRISSVLILTQHAREFVEKNAADCLPYNQGWPDREVQENSTNLISKPRIEINATTGVIQITGFINQKPFVFLLEPTVNGQPLLKCSIKNNIHWLCKDPTSTYTNFFPASCRL